MELAAAESSPRAETSVQPAAAAHGGRAYTFASEPAATTTTTTTACKTYPSYGVLLECNPAELDGSSVSTSPLPSHQSSSSSSAPPAVESKACGTYSMASLPPIVLRPGTPRSGLLGCLSPSHHPGGVEPGPSAFSRELAAAAVAAARKSANAAVGAPLLHVGLAPRWREDLSTRVGTEHSISHNVPVCTDPRSDAANSRSSSEEEGNAFADIPYEHLPDSADETKQPAAVAEPVRRRTVQAAAPASAFADSATPATGNLSFAAASVRGSNNVVVSPSPLQPPSSAIVPGALLPPPPTDRIRPASAVGGQEPAELPLQPIQMSDAVTGSLRPGWQSLQSPRPRPGAQDSDDVGVSPVPVACDSGALHHGPALPIMGEEIVSAVIADCDN